MCSPSNCFSLMNSCLPKQILPRNWIFNEENNCDPNSLFPGNRSYWFYSTLTYTIQDGCGGRFFSKPEWFTNPGIFSSNFHGFHLKIWQICPLLYF